MASITSTETSQSQQNSASQALIEEETILRRKLPAELAEIRGKIEAFGTRDILSQKIQQWYTSFKDELRTPEKLKPILNRNIKLLKNLLRDSYDPRVYLDDQALLGNDGRTYGYKHLCCLLNERDEQYRDRIPDDLENPKVFEIERKHHTARHMVDWLKRHNENLKSEEVNKSEEVDKLFASISEKELKYLLPTEINRERREIRISASKLKEAKKRSEELNRGINEQREKIFSKFDEDISADDKSQNEDLDDLDQQNKKHFRDANDDINQCKKDIHDLDKDLDELDRKKEKFDSNTTQAEKDHTELKSKLKKVEKMRKKRKMGLLKTIAIVGLCAFGTFALNAALGALGTGGSGAVITTGKCVKAVLSVKTF